MMRHGKWIALFLLAAACGGGGGGGGGGPLGGNEERLEGERARSQSASLDVALEESDLPGAPKRFERIESEGGDSIVSEEFYYAEEADASGKNPWVQIVKALPGVYPRHAKFGFWYSDTHNWLPEADDYYYPMYFAENQALPPSRASGGSASYRVRGLAYYQKAGGSPFILFSPAGTLTADFGEATIDGSLRAGKDDIVEDRDRAHSGDHGIALDFSGYINDDEFLGQTSVSETRGVFNPLKDRADGAFTGFFHDDDRNPALPAELSGVFLLGDDDEDGLRGGFFGVRSTAEEAPPEEAPPPPPPPNAPNHLFTEVTGKAAEGEVVLTWDSVGNADGYRIYRDGALLTTITGGGKTTFTDDEPGGAGSYSYAILAYNDDGDSPQTAPTIAVILNLTPPAAPNRLLAQVTGKADDGKIKLTWNRVSGADGYRVYRDGTLLTTVTSGGETSFTDETPGGVGSYSYAILAYNDDGDSPQTAPAIAVILDLAPPAAPNRLLAQVTGKADDGKIKLTWNRVSGADGYRVYRDGTLLTTVTSGGETTFTDEAPGGAGSYSYAILAYNDDGDSPQTAPTIAVIPGFTPPGAPKELLAEVSGKGDAGTIKLNWDPVSGADGYRVYRDGELIATITNGRTTTFTDQKLDGVGSYSYAILAYNDDGDSPQTAPTIAVILNLTPPGAPNNLLAEVTGKADDGTIKLTWNRVSGASGYRVYRNGELITTITSGGTTTFTDDDPGGVGSYSYAILAYNDDGDSPQTAPTIAVILNLTPPVAPDNFVVQVNGEADSAQVALTWGAVADADGYKIYRDGVLIDTVTDATTYTDDAPGGVGSYTYTIIAYNDDGDSDPTAPLVAVVPAVMLPPIPAASPACGEDGAHSLACLAMTLSSPIAASGDAAGVSDGERDGDAFVPIVGNDDGIAFINACLPGDDSCRNIAGEAVEFSPPATSAHWREKFALMFPDEVRALRDNMCARQGRGCDIRGAHYTYEEQTLDYSIGGGQNYNRDAAAAALDENRDIFLAGGVGYRYDSGDASDDSIEPSYSTLARWVFYAVDEDKTDDLLIDFDQARDGYYARYGYSIFAADAVAAPSGGRAKYKVGAQVSYNAPQGDFAAFDWDAERFNGYFDADFGDGSIGGRLSRYMRHQFGPGEEDEYTFFRHLGFDGAIGDNCADGVACFGGTVTARFQITRGRFWEEDFDGQTGTFQGAFYDDADSYDGASAPAEIGGVFGGLFNEDGGELVGGFLGDYITPLPAPANLQAQVEGAGDDGQVHLSWEVVPDAACYYIYRDGVMIYETATAQEVTYTDEDAGAGEHSYSVVAYNAEIESDPTDAVVALIPEPAPAPITPPWTVAQGPACGEAGAHPLACLAMTLSAPIAAVGDAAGGLYAGERDGDAFVPIVGDDGIAFMNGCLPGDGECRDMAAAVTVYNPSLTSAYGGLGVKFVAFFPDELNNWRDNMCAQHGRECATSSGNIPDYGTSFDYTMDERAADDEIAARDVFLAGMVGYHRDDAAADDDLPAYATLARWIFYAIDEDKRDRPAREFGAWEPDQNTTDYYERYGYSIFADNAVAPPSAGEADYQVAARVSYNAPFGDYGSYRWYAEKFRGELTADFAGGSISGRLSRWGARHLDFDGAIGGDCADAATCFSGTVQANFLLGSLNHWEERFHGKTGTFTGGFYDGADSYDGTSAPQEIGGVFGGLFNDDGGELIGGFLGDLEDYIAPLPAPANLQAQVEGAGDDGQVHLSWEVVPDAACYYIYRDGVMIYETATATEVTYTDDDAGAGEHSYSVVAYNAEVESDPTEAVVALIPEPAPAPITPPEAVAQTPACGAEGTHPLACLARTLSNPLEEDPLIAAWRNAADGEDDFIVDPDSNSRIIFNNACPPGVDECYDTSFDVRSNANENAIPGTVNTGQLKKRFEFFTGWRKEIDLLRYNIDYYRGAPEYATVAEWTLTGTVPRLRRYGIFAENLVLPSTRAERAVYQVSARVDFNEPSGPILVGNGPRYYGKTFSGELAADFAAQTISGQINHPWPGYFLRFAGDFEDACDDSAACFRGSVVSGGVFWPDDPMRDFNGKVGTFYGAFYDDPDSYDGADAPQEIAGVIGGMFSDYGYELVGGFVGNKGPLPERPAAVAGFEVNFDSDNKVVLSWDQSSDADAYHIYQTIPGAPSDGIPADYHVGKFDRDVTSITVDFVDFHPDYDLSLRWVILAAQEAEHGEVLSDPLWSPEYWFRLRPPRDLSAEVDPEVDDQGDVGVKLTWGLPINGDGYKIYRDGELIAVIAGRYSTEYTDADAGVGKHEYAIVVYNDQIESSPTDPVVVRISPEAPHFAQHDKIDDEQYTADPARQNLPAADGGRRLADVYVNADGGERTVKHLTYASYGMWEVAPSGERPRDYAYVSFADYRAPELPAAGVAVYGLEGDADYEGEALGLRGALTADFASNAVDAEIVLTHDSVTNLRLRRHPGYAADGPREWGLRMRFLDGEIDADCGCYQAGAPLPIYGLETIDDGTRMTLLMPVDPPGDDALDFGIFDSAFTGDGGGLLGNFHDDSDYDPADGNAPAEVSGHFSSGENHSGEQIKGAFVGARNSQTGIE